MPLLKLPIPRAFLLSSRGALWVSNAGWLTWWLLALAAALVSLASFQAVQHWQTERARLFELMQSPPPVRSAPRVEIDPSLQMSPLSTSVDAVRFVEQAAARLNVHVHRVEVAERMPTPSQLARLELRLVLHGPYGAIKVLLGELATRHSASTLGRLALQPLDLRSASAQGVSPTSDLMPGSKLLQAQMIWVLWGPPLPAEVSSSLVLPAR